MCDRTIFEMWQAEIVHALLRVAGVELALVILNAEPESPSAWARVMRLRRRSLLYRAYRDFGFRPLANRPTDMGWLLTSAPVLTCKVTEVGRYSQHFNERDVSAIESFGLDFVMRFGFNIIRGDILNVARFGIWSFHHGDEQKYRGGPPCFWEIYNGDPVTGVILQRLTATLDGGIVLRKGYFETDPGSYVRTFDRAVLGSVQWPAEVCRDILSGSAAYVGGEQSDTSAPIYRHPSNRQMIGFAFGMMAHRISRLRARGHDRGGVDRW